MFRDQPAQALALVRDSALANQKLRNIGGRPVLVSRPKTQPTERPRTESIKVALAFVAIYLVWGSTYLAIRYAVETIPPLVTAGVRHTIAGGILLAWACLRGYRPRREHWVAGVVLGALFFFIGHGTLHWAEQHVASGLAALLIATEPMFILVLAWATGQQRISRLSALGLAAGIVGVTILTGAEVSSKDASLIGLLAVLVGSLSWAAGVVISPKLKLPTDALARTAVPLVCGAVMLLTTAGLTGEFHGLHW
jgi:drug/metabolite transporter (DMT)-like permease